jgi:hypothetical protein
MVPQQLRQLIQGAPVYLLSTIASRFGLHARHARQSGPDWITKNSYNFGGDELLQVTEG